MSNGKKAKKTSETLAETVNHNGTMLYAPVVACRPLRPEDYPPRYLRVWKEVSATIGFDPIVYTGSVEDSCEACGVTVTVGPRQQDSMALAHGVGLATHVTCLVCAALLTAEMDEAMVASLGNPEDPGVGVVLTPNCPLCSQPPEMILDSGHQAFCGTEDCPAFTWDTFKSVDELMASMQPLDIQEGPDDH